MKTRILIVLLVIVILAAGCSKTAANQTTASTTAATTTAATEGPKDETTAPAESGETSATEETSPETTAAPQPEATEAHTDDALNDYMDSLKAQSNALKASLQEEQSQAELNRISQELYELWDTALNDLWAKLKDSLPDEEFDKLLDEQLIWIDNKETAVAEAGKPYEGGSIYPLIVNREAAQITEDRVAELYQLLK